jgi:hypothetical protein
VRSNNECFASPRAPAWVRADRRHGGGQHRLSAGRKLDASAGRVLAAPGRGIGLPELDADLELRGCPGGANARCTPSAAHPYPVILTERTFASMYNSFGAISPDLVDNGYCVYAFNCGQTIR